MLLLASTAHLGYECMDGWMDIITAKTTVSISTIVCSTVKICELPCY